jgi:hypothetical protein
VSSPFVIWCCQRTGSNSLMDALCAVSEYKPAPPEPFDTRIAEDRHFAEIRKMPPSARDRALEDMCSRRLLIRHCYENLPDEFNLALCRISTKFGYRHVRLLRRDEIGRLISKGIAEQHGTWIPTEWTAARFAEWKAASRMLPPLDVKALKEYHDRCKSRWRTLASMQYLTVMFEDLFVLGPAREVLSRVAIYLDIPQTSVSTMVVNLGRGQNTPGIWSLIPNIDELERAIAR